ncbi:hypothetical protein ACTMTJ_42415 [Phytohabitans sp. LJ34]|uniref:hypothetical protein n=1 Tax=Phytohabitans sp. LJ34 TaxID=3452217 RepID=UPI003F8BA552
MTLSLSLDIHNGHASLTSDDASPPVWEGTLYPAFWVVSGGEPHLVTVTGTRSAGDAVELDFGGLGSGRAVWRSTPNGLDLAELEVSFDDARTSIVDMFFGVRPLTDQQRDAAPDLSLPFWPDWRAAGFCVPSGRPAPAQSFFRRWDLGHARLPLGMFGPAMGSPYAAAFPRPLWAAALGDDRGWLVAGAGQVPDAAMTFEVRSTSAALRWRYREDLWGAPGPRRRWTNPLRLTWAATAWDAYAAYFGSFEVRPSTADRAAASVWNTWGDFRNGHFQLREIADAAADLAADVLVLDDHWESMVSSAKPHPQRFPDFDGDLAYARERGLRLGFWQSVGWIDDPTAVGLTDEDLLRGADGRPRRANWALDPRDPAQHWCLDPSSPRTRAFLVERTQDLVRTYDPAILKLDFGYGLPGPDVAAPADPALRGERLGHELYRIVSEAARATKPDIAILLYGIHPLHLAHADILALDDMGDHGKAEADGHRHWSVWAALAASTGRAINGSSGYSWSDDAEILLDSAVLGQAGAVLPLLSTPGEASPRQLAVRRALDRWCRRTSQWRPLWLNSDLGSLDTPPAVRSWGRLEGERLTALCLRDGADGYDHDGRWAVIAQGDADVRAGAVAAIPMDAGRLALPRTEPPTRVTPDTGWHWDGQRCVLTATDADLDGGLEGWLIHDDR